MEFKSHAEKSSFDRKHSAENQLLILHGSATTAPPQAVMVETHDQGGNCAAQGPRARRVAAGGGTSQGTTGQLSRGVPGEGLAPNSPASVMAQQGNSLADRLRLLLCAAGIIASLMLYSILQVHLPLSLPLRQRPI